MSTAYLQDASIRRRATSMKQFNNQPSIDRQHSKKSFTLNKRSSHIEGSQGNNTFFSIFGDKRRTRDPEAAMDLLDEQIARIRGTLEQMKMEDRHIGERVAMVTAAVDAASSSSSNCSSLESIEEQASCCTKALSTSTNSLPTCNDSKRDSGFIYDPAFEMCDTQRNCMPNNFVKLDPTIKKARSTTAVDFIKNNLHEEECGQRLKATSFDRLSCYSDSALLSIPGLRYR